MNKNRTVPIFVITFMLALLFFLNKTDKPKQDISFGSEPASATGTANKTASIENKGVSEFPDPSLEISFLNSNSEIDPNLTYLQAYRNSVFFKKCYRVINDINKNVSPLIAFEKKASTDFYAVFNKSEKQVTELQLQYFSEFADRCQIFLDSDDETFQSASNRLNKTFSEIQPKTEEEKNLLSGLDLFNKKTDLEKKLYNTKSGTSLLEEVQIKTIYTKIRIHNTQIKEYKANPDWKSNQQIQNAINDLNQKVNDLRLVLSNNKEKHPEKEVIIEAQLIKHKTIMVDFLKQNNSSDILLLYAQYLFNPYGENNSQINQELRKELNIYDNILMKNIYEVGIKLAACAMNYPCDDRSEFIYDYCIGLSITLTYPSSCGKGLEAFYFNSYLGPNQLEDVSKYLNYILENYAK